MTTAEIGRIIKGRRRLLGVDQQMLAQLSGISVHTLSNVESGKGNPSLAVMQRMLEALGLEFTVGVKNIG